MAIRMQSACNQRTSFGPSAGGRGGMQPAWGGYSRRAGSRARAQRRAMKRGDECRGGAPGEAPPGEAPPGEAPPGEAPPGEAPPGEAPPGEAPSGEAPSGESAVRAEWRGPSPSPCQWAGHGERTLAPSE